MRRVALVTDARVARLPSLRSRAPRRYARPAATSRSTMRWPSNRRASPSRRATAFARDAGVDGFVSVGGGSAIDTAKAANLYATYPADLDAYVNAPIGRGEPVPGPLRPHIACPTTCGTGAEVTGIAIFDDVARNLKTGIASKRLRPDARHHRPGRDRDASGDGRRVQRIRRARARARELYGAPVHAARASGDARRAAGFAGREPVLRYRRRRSAAHHRREPGARRERSGRCRGARAHDVRGDSCGHRFR